MATTNDYPSYLPDDFKGLESIQEGNQRYYYKQKDGRNLLIGAIVGKRHLIIRFPEGSTIDIVPPDSVGTRQIQDDSVEMEDLNQKVKDKMMTDDDRVTQQDIENFNV